MMTDVSIKFVFYYLSSIFFVQDQETTNNPKFTDVFRAPSSGRLLALDPGTKKVGLAVSDELQLTVRRVGVIPRTGWKKFLKKIIGFLDEFDAKALVIGLPYNFDGSESEMSAEARRLARNFSLSLEIPVILQDERNTSYAARGNLWEKGMSEKEARAAADAEAAAIILTDFIDLRKQLAAEQNPKSKI